MRNAPGSMLEYALFLHLLGAFLFAAGIVVAGVAFEAARRREAPAEIALLLGLTRIGVLLVAAGSLLLLGFGLWLVDLSGWTFDAGWIQAAIGLFVLALLLGGLAGQRPKRARKLAAQLAEEESAPARAGHAAPTGTGRAEDGTRSDLRALLDDPLSLAANYASSAIVLAILALMAFKP